MNLFTSHIKQKKRWSVYKCFLLLSIIIIIQGCAPRSDKNKTLSPPADTEWVTVGIKLPEGIEALPLNVLYRSEICQRAQYNSAGEKEYISGFNPNAVALKQRGNSDIYQTQIALNGGGSCQWQLSEVWMSIVYQKTLNIDSDFETIPSGKLILTFNDHKFEPKRTSRELIKNGIIKIDYYPLFVTNKIISKKMFFLFDKLNRSQYISTENKRNILFTPIYHNANITKVNIYSKLKNENIIYYSDGTIEKSSSWTPNYNKLKSIN